MPLGNLTQNRIAVNWHLPRDAGPLANEVCEYFGDKSLKTSMRDLFEKAAGEKAIIGAAIAFIKSGANDQVSFYFLTDPNLIEESHTPTDSLRDIYRRLLEGAYRRIDLDVFFANTRGERLEEAAARLARKCHARRVELADVEAERS